MSAPSQPAKQASRWGGFLEKTLASVESRLDNILAEDDTTQSKATPAPQEQTPERQTTLSPPSPKKRPESRSGERA